MGWPSRALNRHLEEHPDKETPHMAAHLDMHRRPSLPEWLCTKSLELAAGRRARPSLTHRNPAAESRIVQPR